MTIQYKTRGVCSRQMNVKLEAGVVKSVEVVGGCHGNLQGIARLVEGMRDRCLLCSGPFLPPPDRRSA